MKTNIYFFPGLAANAKIFKNIKLDKNKFNINYLSWQQPLTANEPITSYAKRMCQFIQHENPVLIGVSFGGIMVQEMCKIINTQKTIIISSIKSNKELPKSLKLAKATKAYKLFPTKAIANLESYEKYFLGDFLQKKKELYKTYMSVRDPLYLNWAIQTVLHWQQEEVLKDIIHIHGTEDGVFPKKYITNAIEIPNGNHAMILTKAKAISKIIEQQLT